MIVTDSIHDFKPIIMAYAFFRRCHICQVIHTLSLYHWKWMVPHPNGCTVNGPNASVLLQIVAIVISLTASGKLYNLMLLDDQVSCSTLYVYTNINDEYLALAALDWVWVFGAPLRLVSDGLKHFRSATVHLVCKDSYVLYCFTLRYTSWRNGKYERIREALPRVFRSIFPNVLFVPQNG